MEQNVIDKMWN